MNMIGIFIQYLRIILNEYFGILTINIEVSLLNFVQLEQSKFATAGQKVLGQ